MFKNKKILIIEVEDKEEVGVVVEVIMTQITKEDTIKGTQMLDLG